MKSFRSILWPFSLLYGLITFARNKCYDWGVFQVTPIPRKSICIGNLSAGGTGKTPHVAYLADYIGSTFETTILSRGYGRTTKGFQLVQENSSAKNVGDEPLFYATLFKDKIHVVVCENRVNGVKHILQQFPTNQVILLDDAFQHRAVKAGLNILLTDFNAPYFRDSMLPSGNLREWIRGINRADYVVVTKCPSEITEKEKNYFYAKLGVAENKIYFSTIKYGELTSFGKPLKKKIENVLLVTGIANPKPLKEHLAQNYSVEQLIFPDHHVFTQKDIEEIHQKIDTFVDENAIIVTTEKDFMRLKENLLKWNMHNYPWYFQPMHISIHDELQFKEELIKYVNTI
jgi:tetraacyldisaccharide 4'-kinase